MPKQEIIKVFWRQLALELIITILPCNLSNSLFLKLWFYLWGTFHNNAASIMCESIFILICYMCKWTHKSLLQKFGLMGLVATVGLFPLPAIVIPPTTIAGDVPLGTDAIAGDDLLDAVPEGDTGATTAWGFPPLVSTLHPTTAGWPQGLLEPVGENDCWTLVFAVAVTKMGCTYWWKESGWT
jgi:hypothetical protein